MDAETAYVFRHALLREAAYQLQLPGDRARLHALALTLIEAVCGGRPPEPPPLTEAGAARIAGHPTDPYADELAEHARLAQAAPDLRRLYLRRAAASAGARFQPEAESRFWELYSALAEDDEKSEALRRASVPHRLTGRQADLDALLARALAAARAIHTQVGNRRSVGNTLGHLAALCRGAGRTAEAGRLFEEALAIHREVRNPASEGGTLCEQALLFLDQGRIEDARRVWKEGAALLRETGEERQLARLLTTLDVDDLQPDYLAIGFGAGGLLVPLTALRGCSSSGEMVGSGGIIH